MKKRIIKIIVALMIFLIALIFKFDNNLINNILFIVSYLIVGIEILFEATKNITKGKLFDENFLMSIATIGAFIIGEAPEAVAVMLFYQIGETFQNYAVEKSKKSIADLMNIKPDYANIYVDGKDEKINPENVKINDLIIVKPGEKIPLDGIVIDGSSNIDTKALTGEIIPRSITINDEVLSGSINLSGVIKVRVTKTFKQSTVSKILDLVENASNKKSKSENFITKFASFYTPIVVFIALILATVVPLITDASFNTWLYRALSFLVVSCPCALVISIPLSFFGGIGGASKLGILIKGSNYLELLSKADTIVFDKTGTLTKGIFEIQKINSINVTDEELLKYVCYAENYSLHPIATAVKNKYNKKIDNKKIKSIKEIAGLGIEAKIDNHKILVGNEKLLEKNKINFNKFNGVGTIIYVALDNKYIGNILISDTIKNDAYDTIIKLKEQNIKNIIMLTGDKKDIGNYVADKLKIDKVYTDLLPQDKVKIVEKFNANSIGKLIFVGDGINDAPVLALADIGISMGSIGTDSAIEASDIVIMTDELSKIVEAIKLSHKTMKIVKQNIVFAISVKIIVLIFAVLGISTMWEAVFADVGVSIIAILNSLRMLKVRRK